MNKRLSYYVDRKQLLSWLAVLALVCSVIARIADFCRKGADTTTVWLLLVLPVFACLCFVLTLLLDGEEHLYRTAIPAFLLAIYFGLRACLTFTGIRLILLSWVAYLAFAVLYWFILSGKPHAWLLILAFLTALTFKCYACRHALRSGDPLLMLAVAPDILLLFGGFCLAAGMKVHLDNGYHPTWGDRPDGRKLRSLDPVQVVANYIMPTRVGSSNSVRDSIEITAMERYIREKRRQGLTNFGITHVFLATYVRLIAKYPALNRFLSGQQVYSRDEDIQFCMMVKEEMTTDSAESAMKLHLKPGDTVEDIYRKFNDEVNRIKGATDASDFDKTAKALSLVPGVCFKFVVWLLKVMDYFGLLPKFLLEVSPFHGSVFFTSMGSLGIPPIIHHLYNFGNLPVFIAFGCKYRRNELNDEGEVVQRKYIDFTVNTDERICDGFYFATTLKYMKKLLAHPERLDVPPEEIVKDID